MNASRYSTHWGLVGMAALWGASWPWGRIVAQSMPPLAAASLRFLLASAVLLLWLHRSGRTGALRALGPRQWMGLACASAVGVLGYSVFFMLALQTVPAGKAAMVVALNPVLTMLFAVLLFREAVSASRCLGLVLAVTGALYALSGGSLAFLRPPAASGRELCCRAAARCKLGAGGSCGTEGVGGCPCPGLVQHCGTRFRRYSAGLHLVFEWSESAGAWGRRSVYGSGALVWHGFFRLLAGRAFHRIVAPWRRYGHFGHAVDELGPLPDGEPRWQICAIEPDRT